jgi:hypothetical protein
MCSKMNPAELDVCQYCEARLKPLIAPQAPNPAGTDYQFGQEEDLPDWLKSLTPAGEPPDTPPAKEKDPEWLLRIREKSQKDSLPQEEDVPEWLQNIRGGEGDQPAGPVTGSLPGTPAAPVVTGSLGGDLDWIDRLKTGHLNLPPEMVDDPYPREEKPSAQNVPQPPEDPERAKPQDVEKKPAPGPVEPGIHPGMHTGSLGSPEWIDRLKTGHLTLPPEMDEKPPAGQPSAGQDAPGTPAAEENGAPPAAPVVTGSLGGDLDWIDRLKTGHLNLPLELADETHVPSELANDGQADQPAAGFDLPFKTEESSGSDFLTGALLEEPEPGKPEPGEPGQGIPHLDPFPAVSSDDTPDWLKDFAVLASDKAEPATAKNLEGGQELAETGSDLPTASAFDQLPDWLKTSQPDGAQAEVIPWSSLQESQDAVSSDIPDWLSNLTADRPDQAAHSGGDTAADLPSKSATAPGEIPSWDDIASSFTSSTGSSRPLSNLGRDPVSPPSEPSPFSHFLVEPAPTEAPAQPQPPAPAAPSIKDDTPDWLAALEAHSTIKPVESTVPALTFDEPTASKAETTVEPFVLADLPDWLAGLGPVRAAGASVAQPVEPADLPETFAIGAGPETEMAEGEAEALAPAELPSWIQALRPIESVAPKAVESEVDQRVEKSGPLAGLRGALPAESLASSAVKPPSFAARLEATDTQKRYAQIFDEMIAAETDPQPAQAEQLISSHRILRLVLAILLLVVVGYPTLTRTKLLPIPGLYSQEVILLRQAVDALPENAPVLLAVDYEMPLSGEMETTAYSVVDHLMARGARLVTISTSPTGPVLSASLMERVTAQPAAHRTAYQDGTRWISLGYLAGGPAGLLNFAATPALAVPAYQADGERAWAKPVMQGVNSLGDFAMVVVVTDSYDTGRIWLEQIQPVLGAQIPFLMVASAQAAPLLRPYLDGGQADGLVSGLAGAASYEQLRQQPGSATASWDAYQAGMIASIGLVLIGGIVYLILGMVKRPQPKKEAAASEGVEQHGSG